MSHPVRMASDRSEWSITRHIARRAFHASALATALLLAACGSTSQPSKQTSQPGTSAASPAKPRLIVFMAIDGLPMRQVTGYRDQFAPDGFLRFLDRGRWFSDAHYGHGHTVTAAGHAVMLTGAYPHRSGIITNEWRDPKTGEEVYCTGDTAHHYVGNKTEPLDGTSPRNLKVEGLGDVLQRVQPASKVIGISGKDRGAILPVTHKGTAYMYMKDSGQFASTTYYMPSHPKWVQDFNAARPADAFFGKTWNPLLPEAAYARSAPDGQAWQYSGGNGNKLPITMGAKQTGPSPAYYDSILPTPFGDELTLAFARAAIEGEQLGRDDATDILSVSLSSHDYVNHAYGPESRLSHDHMLRLDRHLQAFFGYLDQRVGAGNYMLMLTADHGFLDTPEWAALQGRDAGRLDPGKLRDAMQAGLVRRFGEGKWVGAGSGAGYLFDEALIRSKGLDPETVYAEAAVHARQVKGVAAAFTRAQMAGTDTATPYLAAMRKSWDPERAAPLQIVVQPNWLISSRPTGTSHGSPHRYDTHVPVLAWGEAWVGRGEVKTPVEVADIAPTLARVLGVPAPAQSEGRPLPLPAVVAR